MHYQRKRPNLARAFTGPSVTITSRGYIMEVRDEMDTLSSESLILEFAGHLAPGGVRR